jgi:hypothetical protein
VRRPTSAGRGRCDGRDRGHLGRSVGRRWRCAQAGCRRLRRGIRRPRSEPPRQCRDCPPGRVGVQSYVGLLFGPRPCCSLASRLPPAVWSPAKLDGWPYSPGSSLWQSGSTSATAAWTATSSGSPALVSACLAGLVVALVSLGPAAAVGSAPVSSDSRLKRRRAGYGEARTLQLAPPSRDCLIRPLCKAT